MTMEKLDKDTTIQRVFDRDGKLYDGVTILHLWGNNKEFKHKNRMKVDGFGLTCGCCNESVIIAGGKLRGHYLKHGKGGKHRDTCPWYSENDPMTPKQIDALHYNGVKEGGKHEEYKNFIANMLKKDLSFSSVAVEKRITGETVLQRASWRQPDVFAIFKEEINIDFEVQLQTILMTHIEGRRDFYQEKNIFMLWLFDYNDIANYRFSENDIFFTNNQNGFFFNEECKKKSIEQRKLIVGVVYRRYFLDEGGEEEWETLNEFISIEQLTFNPNTREVYFFDTEAERALNVLEIEKNYIYKGVEFYIQKAKSNYFYLKFKATPRGFFVAMKDRNNKNYFGETIEDVRDAFFENFKRVTNSASIFSK
jgi:hypothetical protein